jgi:DNA-binding FadR family transcriptional regulator
MNAERAYASSGSTTRSRGEEIAVELRSEILSGRYRPGERLPSERDLAVRFAVGRGTVREAFKKLEQLGLVAVQHGGARVVPIEECTLDVLGPLLDLQDVPDAGLVDQVLELFGVLLSTAARSAVRRAPPEELARAKRIVAEMRRGAGNGARQHAALRDLAELFIEIADHLVLRLTINGLRTNFFARLQSAGTAPRLDADVYGEIAARLHDALERRDEEAVVDQMQRLNDLIRESARKALERAHAKRRKLA